MLGAYVLVPQSLRFFRGKIENALALLAQRNFYRGRNALAHGDPCFYFFANGFDRAVRAQEPVRQRLILAQQSQEQVLRLDVGASVLARLVPCKKYHAPSFLCIAFKHGSPTLSPGSWSGPQLQKGLRNLPVCFQSAPAFHVPESERGRSVALRINCVSLE